MVHVVDMRGAATGGESVLKGWTIEVYAFKEVAKHVDVVRCVERAFIRGVSEDVRREAVEYLGDIGLTHWEDEPKSLAREAAENKIAMWDTDAPIDIEGCSAYNETEFIRIKPTTWKAQLCWV